MENPYKFTCREYDGEIGLYYYRARHYSPFLMRFLQKDPEGMVDGTNMYAYCSNNPVNNVDPSGNMRIRFLKWWWIPYAVRFLFSKRETRLAALGLTIFVMWGLIALGIAVVMGLGPVGWAILSYVVGNFLAYGTAYAWNCYIRGKKLYLQVPIWIIMSWGCYR